MGKHTAVEFVKTEMSVNVESHLFNKEISAMLILSCDQNAPG